VHPGGPYWARRDAGAWSIPKGECRPCADLLEVACREMEEETGCRPTGPFLALAPVRQRGGKVVHAWAVEADCDVSELRSNTFSLEWPPRSGVRREFPEVDRAEWFALDEARLRINEGQRPLLAQLQTMLEAP